MTSRGQQEYIRSFPSSGLAFGSPEDRLQRESSPGLPVSISGPLAARYARPRGAGMSEKHSRRACPGYPDPVRTAVRPKWCQARA